MSVALIGALSLKDFEGAWQLERDIVSGDAPAAHFKGRALWTPEGKNMRYREQGQLVLKGQQSMHAEREYIWTPDLDVYFPDGRFFHSVRLTGAVAEHWCDPDTYLGTYDFLDWPVFRVSWCVSGPKKDYRSQSQYRRL